MQTQAISAFLKEVGVVRANEMTEIDMLGHHSLLQSLSIQSENSVLRIYILIVKANKLFSFFSSRCFLKEIKTCSPCFYRVIETLVKVWENSKKLWKHSPAARVPTAFLLLPNFHSCFYNITR